MWFGRNSIDKNFDYIETLLNHYKIEKWHLTIVDFRILHQGKTYRIEIDKEIMGLRLFELNTVGNGKLKEYWHIVDKAGENGVFLGEDCWLDCILFIKNKGRYKNARVS